jgi:hypothetical protein
VAKVSSSRVKLAWSPLAAGLTVTYQVYRDGKSIGTGTKASFFDTTVKSATTYRYAVRVLTAAGQPGILSQAIKVTTPKPPGSWFPGAANTGYQHAPGYPGHLTDCSNLAVQSTWMAAGNNGLFWWPGDGNPSGPGQIIGHSSDYPGP